MRTKELNSSLIINGEWGRLNLSVLRVFRKIFLQIGVEKYMNKRILKTTLLWTSGNIGGTKENCYLV